MSFKTLLGAALLAGSGLAHLGLRWWIRRRAQRDRVDPDGTSAPAADERTWIPRGLLAIATPLACLLWTHGAYFALQLMVRRLAPLGEDVLVRIVLPDDAGQLRKRVGLLPRAGRLPCSAQLALEIFEIERETVPSWLTHGTIHSSTSRFFLWKNRELCAVNLTLCAPPEKPFPSAHLFRRRNSGDSQTGSKDAAHRVHERQSRQGRLSISLINEP